MGEIDEKRIEKTRYYELYLNIRALGSGPSKKQYNSDEMAISDFRFMIPSTESKSIHVDPFQTRRDARQPRRMGTKSIETTTDHQTRFQVLLLLSARHHIVPFDPARSNTASLTHLFV
jgi:hypothetical protein